MTLDNFDVIIGLNFLKKAKIDLMFHLDGILLVNELDPSFVPCHKVVVNESRKESNLVLAIIISKAFKKVVKCSWW